MSEGAAAEWVDVGGLGEWRGESPKTLRRKLPELYKMGFPQPVLGKWYLPACKEWAGEKTASNSETLLGDPLMDAIDGHRFN